MSDLAFIITTVICLILSAFFSATETAITAASLGKIKKLESDGNKAAKKILQLREEKEIFLATLLVGNNGAMIVASSLSAVFMNHLLGEEGLFISTVIMTIFIIIFIEVLPKTLALRNPEALSLKTAGLLSIIVILLKPVTITTKFVVGKIIGTSSEHPKKMDISIIDELKGTLALHEDHGGVKKVDKDILGGVLDLDKMIVDDVMLHRKFISSINADQPVEKIIAQAYALGYSKIPLWQKSKENIIGVLDLKELSRFIGQSNQPFKDINLTTFIDKPWFVPVYTTIKNQLMAFRERKYHFAVVISEYGDIKGIITLHNILEEIVGKIEEEEEACRGTGVDGDIEKKADHIYQVNADFSVRNFIRSTDIKLPELEATTIGGLVINIAGRIPEVEEEIKHSNISFKILSKKGKKLHSILVHKLDA